MRDTSGPLLPPNHAYTVQSNLPDTACGQTHYLRFSYYRPVLQHKKDKLYVHDEDSCMLGTGSCLWTL